MKNPLQVVVIGGGPGGLALAQGLKKAGIGVQVFERDRTRSDVVHAFRLRLRTRGVDALRHCLPDELFRAFVRTCGHAPANVVHVDEQLRPEPTLALAPDADMQLDKSVSRITLQHILQAGLGDALHFGKAFIGYEERADGRICAHFDDGSTAVADVLVGADGAASRVRRQLLPNAPWVDTGAQRIAGKIDLTPRNRDLLAPWLYEQTANVYAEGGFHLFVTTHRVNHQAAHEGDAVFTASDDELAPSGLMFDNRRDYVFWALGVPHDRLPPDGTASMLDWVQSIARSWHPQLRALLRLTDPDTVNATPIRTSLPVDAWPTRRVTLLGDAIHSTTYFRAVGANAALADARLLCDTLRAVQQGREPLLDALNGYEATMLSQGFAGVRSSLDAFVQLLGDGESVERWPQVVLEPVRAPTAPAPIERHGTTPARPAGWIARDPRSQELLAQVERVALSGATALLIGETGTGKELVARHLHDCSGRNGAFVAVNCAAFTETLIDAELFGHESGAFTGAQHARGGWFEAAEGGTLFLDEIGDMPLSFQVKLLRVLQERQVVRIGSREPRSVDVRIVAATNVDLQRAVREGRFRADLYYRLHVAALHLPPLRERPADVLPLARHFAGMYRRKLDTPSLGFSPEAEQALRRHDWPGNIRELENVVHYATIVSDGCIEREHLRLPDVDPAPPRHDALVQLRQAVRRLLDQPDANVYDTIEETVIATAFAYCDDNQLRTARELGVSRNVLRGQLKRFGLLGVS
jgi:sigma-54-specific transcriptional regulator